MKGNYLRAFSLSLGTAGLLLGTGCVIDTSTGRIGFQQPTITVTTETVPPPGPVVVEEQTVMVPDAYVWDGYETVGIIGAGYVYLGPGNVWLPFEPFRWERFHRWEAYHGDWRLHAIINERYRRDRFGHVHEFRREEVTRRLENVRRAETQRLRQPAKPPGKKVAKNQKEEKH